MPLPDSLPVANETAEQPDRDSVVAVRDCLSELSRTEKVDESWDAMLAALRRVSTQHRRAYHAEPRLFKETTRCLLDLMLRGSPSVDIASRIVEMHRRLLIVVDPDDQCWCNFLLGPLHGDVRKFKHARGSGGRIGRGTFSQTFRGFDKQFLQVLVAYGLTPRLEMSRRSFCRQWQFIFNRVRPRSGCRMYRQLKKACGSMTANTRRGFGRIPLIVRTLHASAIVYTNRPRKMEAYAAMLKTYFDTVRDPLVSLQEVREFLRLELGGLPAEVDRMVKIFADLFDGEEPYQARRLSHLCRCALRETLVQNSPVTLPAAVERLNLPKRIKRFILCCPRWRST